MAKMPKLLVAATTLITSVACSAGMCPTPTSSQKASMFSGTIAVGVTNDSPGFASGGASGNATGFDIQVMRALDDEKDRRLTAPTILTVADRGSSLKRGTAELVIATYSITERRNKEDGIDFAGPYITTPQALLVRADNDDIRDKDDLKDKAVCSVEGTTGHEVPIPDANMSGTGKTTAACVELLKRNLTDAVFDDELILRGFTNAYPGKFKVILPTAFGNQQNYGIALLGGHKDECHKINDIIKSYLRTQWKTDFRAALPDAVEAYPGDFETRFKPTESSIEKISCRLS